MSASSIDHATFQLDLSLEKSFQALSRPLENHLQQNLNLRRPSPCLPAPGPPPDQHSALASQPQPFASACPALSSSHPPPAARSIHLPHSGFSPIPLGVSLGTWHSARCSHLGRTRLGRAKIREKEWARAGSMQMPAGQGPGRGSASALSLQPRS